MKYKEHCAECREKMGKDWAVVHRWLDHYAGLTWPSDAHRAYRHHTDGVEVCRHLWGDEGAEAARLHILSDVKAYGLDHVPTAQELEAVLKSRGIQVPSSY